LKDKNNKKRAKNNSIGIKKLEDGFFKKENYIVLLLNPI